MDWSEVVKNSGACLIVVGAVLSIGQLFRNCMRNGFAVKPWSLPSGAEEWGEAAFSLGWVLLSSSEIAGILQSSPAVPNVTIWLVVGAIFAFWCGLSLGRLDRSWHLRRKAAAEIKDNPSRP